MSPQRRRVALTTALPAQPAEAPANGAAGLAAGQWEQLRAADLRFAGIANRLIVANAPLCDHLMPATGMVLHAIGQYPANDRPSARLAFGFEAPVSVEAVVPESAAGRAGVRANDGIAAIGGVALDCRPSRKARHRAPRAMLSSASLPRCRQASRSCSIWSARADA